ncbi:NACHT domain-containing protein [Dictyobacter arantiisoli]|uniref:NACHT domain-containing protein n=1 Tax=Dictyobacter arantiisoli TaxID=2014874 RepID=A0A5A5T5N0_9CHLR|nr:HEAT repeat domain-containing protein [Dictyobacter arantiisoli]GCF06476.1 hypothetical protein KDI_00400 [Dictyobacter arantiisoli]
MLDSKTLIEPILHLIQDHLDSWIQAIVPLLGTGIAAAFGVGFHAIIAQARKRTPPQESQSEKIDQNKFKHAITAYEQSVLTNSHIAQIQIIDMPHPLNLLEVYVPLHLRSHSALPYTINLIYEENDEIPDSEQLLLAPSNTHLYTDNTPILDKDILQHYKRCIIIGDPGSGKTTLLHYLALKTAQHTLESAPCTPVYIALTTFDCERHKNLFELILAQFEHFGDLPALSARLQLAMKAGQILLLLDGLDETRSSTPARNTYDFLVGNIKQLVNRYADMPMVISVRKAGYQQRVKITGFNELEIMDFQIEESRTFIENWFRAYPTNQKEEKIKALTGYLERNVRIQTLATNPLLLSLIAIVCERQRRMPTHKAQLYRACIDILQTGWDTSRDIARSQTFTQIALSRLYEEIAWHFHNQKKRYFPLDELLAVLQNYSQTSHMPLESCQQFLNQIAIDNGLLREQAHGWYGFSHLTFQEYFVTQYIIRNQQQKLLRQHFVDPWWEEVILLYASSTSDASQLLSILLGQHRQLYNTDDLFHTHLLLAGRCLGENPRVKQQKLPEQIIDQLLQTLQSTPYALDRERIASILAGMDHAHANHHLLQILTAPASTPDHIYECVVRAIGYAGNPSFATELVALLGQSHIARYKRIMLARALGILQETHTGKQLVRLLVNPKEDPFVRQGVGMTIGQLGESSALSALIHVSQQADEHTLVLQSIAFALEKLGGPQAIQALITMVQNRLLDSAVRGSSIRMLGKLHARSSIPLLETILKDREENIYVRRCAALALGEFSYAEIPVPTMLALLHSKYVETGVRVSIANSFATLGDPRVASELIEVLLNQDCHIKVRMSVALTLGFLKQREQILTLRSIAQEQQHGDVNLYTCLIVALSMLGVSTVINDLVDLLLHPDIAHDTLPHIVNALLIQAEQHTIDTHAMARKMVGHLQVVTLDRYRGQCILKVLCKLRVTAIVPELCLLLAEPAIDRTLRRGIADSIAQLAQDDETAQSLAQLLPASDIPDDIYLTCWIVNRRARKNASTISEKSPP